MESELPTWEKRPARPTPPAFGMLETGQVTPELGQTNMEFHTTVCKGNRKADVLTAGLKVKDIL